MDVVGDEGGVEEDAEPLASDQEEKVEEDVENVLWQHQGIEGGALVYRILVVSFQLIEGNYVEDGEEDEEGVDDERHDVGECSEGESHPESSELCLL